MSQTSRRAFLSAAASAPIAALPVAASAKPVPIGIPLTSPEDAELIAACERHSANLDAYEASTDLRDSDEHPLWHAYKATRDFIENAEPQSLVGMLAKARAAKYEARHAYRDGREAWEEYALAARWAGHLVNDLLRLGSHVVPAAWSAKAVSVAAGSHPDAELLRLCTELAACWTELDHLQAQKASDGEWNVAMDRWVNLVEQITDTPARSPEGLRAKANAARCVLKKHKFGGSGPIKVDIAACEEDLLSWSLIHDLLGEEPQWS
jgi:hypothetical protein